MSRYLVGIDLGTTNCVVCYIDKTAESSVPILFKIPQLSDPGELKEEVILPSFVYIPDENDIPEGSLALPWKEKQELAVGELARKMSPKVPTKVVASVKSWLCADNVDRMSAILPWNRNNPKKQLSPLDATTTIIEHMKNAWNSQMAAEKPEDILENQTVVITVPASFDAVARELTVKAAGLAGLEIILLEEPQAAFYSWLNEHGEDWRKKVSAGDVILVCDIGGGTTDFSLIKVSDAEGNLTLERVAVGNHILLGGDNMDLTLAYSIAGKLKKENNMVLDAYQITGLTYGCRRAKESLMSDSGTKSEKLTVLGRGSSMIANTISTELSRNEVYEILIDGFFPECALEDKPTDSRRAGLRTFGLKYESDPAITKHLAAFLNSNCKSEKDLPNCILFNGGVTKADVIKDRIVKVIKSWASGTRDVKILTGTNPDLAVALGASCYAFVKEGSGIRIKAGSSRSYYLGVETSMPAVPGFLPPMQGLCVLPVGAEEGTSLDIDYSGLGLIVGETTDFHFYSSKFKKNGKTGSVIDNIENSPDIDELPSLAVNLEPYGDIPSGSLVPVNLHVEYTETGTLQVWCIDKRSENRWKLDFEIRKDQNQN